MVYRAIALLQNIYDFEIAKSEVSVLPVGRGQSHKRVGVGNFPQKWSSTIRVLARPITVPPVSDVHVYTVKGHLPLLVNEEGRPIG